MEYTYSLECIYHWYKPHLYASLRCNLHAETFFHLYPSASFVKWNCIETQYSTGCSWRPPSMHCILWFTFVTFLILWPLSPASSSVSWYRSCLVCSGLSYEIYSGDGPSIYVCCVVCYRVIVAPYVRSIRNVFENLYDDDLEYPTLRKDFVILQLYWWLFRSTTHCGWNMV